MKKVLLLAGLCLLHGPLAHAGVAVTGADDTIQFDATRFPPYLREDVATINTKCVACHSLARVVDSLESRRTTSGSPFGKPEIRLLVIKKRRNPAANMNAEDARAIIRFFDYMLDKNG